MIYPLTPELFNALVLAVTEEEDAYGYMIAQRIRQVASQKESTLYPVLKRLTAVGCLTTYDQEYQGRNRRYYRITDEGRKQLMTYREEWLCFKTAADQILCGGEGNE